MAQDQNATQTTSTQNHSSSSSSSEGELDLQTWSKNQAWHCEACVWHCVAAFEGEIVCKTGGQQQQQQQQQRVIQGQPILMPSCTIYKCKQFNLSENFVVLASSMKMHN